MLQEAGLDLGDHVYRGDLQLFNRAQYAELEASIAPWFDGVMLKPDRPTVIFTSFESVGEILYLLAIRKGISVPDDLSIVTVGGSERSGAIVRRLSCVTLDEQQAGAVTAELLDEMSQGQRGLTDAEVFTIRVDFDPGETLAEVF